MKTYSNLDDFLPYLIQQIGGQIDDAVDVAAKKAGLTKEMYRVLVVIYQLGPQNLVELSHHTCINNSTLSRLVGRMQNEELISRELGGTGRAVKIDLLPKGKEKLLSLLPLTEQIKELINSQFSEEEFEQVKSVLAKLYDLFEKLPEPPSNK